MKRTPQREAIRSDTTVTPITAANFATVGQDGSRAYAWRVATVDTKGVPRMPYTRDTSVTGVTHSPSIGLWNALQFEKTPDATRDLR